MTTDFSRRYFLKGTAAAAAVLGPTIHILRGADAPKRLKLGGIGCKGKGESDLAGMFRTGKVDMVALCDVDDNSLNDAAKKYPGAKLYNDYREMLEKEKEIEAVTVSIPDFHHAPAAIRAINLGKHVFVQKPLTHTMEEARKLTLAAREHKVVTAMGNQGHSGQ